MTRDGGPLSPLSRQASDCHFKSLHFAQRDKGWEFATDVAVGTIDGCERFLEGEPAHLDEDDAEYVAKAARAAPFNISVN